MKVTYKHCVVCGNKFPAHGKKKYCSPECKHKAVKKQKRDWWFRHRVLDEKQSARRELEQAYGIDSDDLSKKLQEDYYKTHDKQALQAKRAKKLKDQYAFVTEEFAFGDFTNYE